MKELPIQFVTYYEKQLEIAKRFISIRKKNKISQQKLSGISGVAYASIRRFEKTGDISLASLVKISLALHLYDDLDNLFNHKHEYASIEDVINDRKG